MSIRDDDELGLTSRPLGRIVFTQKLSTAEELMEVIDRASCTRITTGARPIQRYLPLGDIREVRDEDDRPWLVTVSDGKVTAGFLLEDTFAEGEVGDLHGRGGRARRLPWVAPPRPPPALSAVACLARTVPLGISQEGR